jgi:hypothetical protein
MNDKAGIMLAHYFGLPVTVIRRMECCCLIRFRGREFIVDTADLVFRRGLKQAA